MVDAATAEADFDGPSLAKRLLRVTRAGALATLDRHAGFPIASLVTVATDLDGSPLLLLSRLSTHTLNLEADPRVSLLLAAGGKGDPLAHPRLTLVGHASRSGEPRARARFLARHPKAKLYADFADFSFWRLALRSAHLNGGFARAVSIEAAALLTDLTGAEDLVQNESEVLARLNGDRRVTTSLYATRLGRERSGAWRASGVDPEGLDLISGDRATRVPFPKPVRSASELGRMLDALSDAAGASTPLSREAEG